MKDFYNPWIEILEKAIDILETPPVEIYVSQAFFDDLDDNHKLERVSQANSIGPKTLFIYGELRIPLIVNESLQGGQYHLVNINRQISPTRTSKKPT